MGDQRLSGNHPRRILKSAPQDTTGKLRHKDQLTSKYSLKSKKEQLKFPSSLEGQHRLFRKASQDDVRKGCTPREGVNSRGLEGAFFPTISHRVPSSKNSKSHKKLSEDRRLFRSLSSRRHGRRAFWESIGSRQNKLSPWPQGEDNSADLLIKWLDAQKPEKLESKWPFWDRHIEAIKQAMKDGNYPEGNLDDDNNSLWPWEGRCCYESTHRPQDLLSTIYYTYIYKGGEPVFDWTKPFEDRSLMQQVDGVGECQLHLEDSPVKKTSLLAPALKQRTKMNKVKNIRLSKQESSFKMKYKKPHNARNTNKIKCGTSYLKSNQLKKRGNEEPLTVPKVLLEIQGAHPGKPDTIEEFLEPSVFKDSIVSQGDSMPGVLENLFRRKGWDYGPSNTPMPTIIKAREWFLYQNEEDEEEEEEEEDN